MREFNTKVEEGNYSITFETDDRNAYEQVQSLCRLLVDGKNGDAVPIDWIEDWQYRHEWQYESYFSMRDGIPKYAIECMLEDWEKENADTD